MDNLSEQQKYVSMKPDEKPEKYMEGLLKWIEQAVYSEIRKRVNWLITNQAVLEAIDATLRTDIDTNTSDISTNGDDITTNADDISTNTGDISTNADDIDALEAGAGLLTIEAHTSDDTLTAAESGSVHTNLGAGGTITLTLPSNPPTGTYFYFCIETQQFMRIEPGDGVKIMDTIGQTPGSYKYTGTIGATYGVIFDGSDWAVLDKHVSWQEE